VNFKWPQGEDLNIQLIYKEGDTPQKAVPVPLASGYALRMDIVTSGTTKRLVYSFTSEAHSGVLGTGANKQPNINIFLDRDLTLPGGVIYQEMNASTPMSTFSYDIFIRNTTTDRQVKILRGSITVEASNTLWV
jgi:hypothetical protein